MHRNMLLRCMGHSTGVHGVKKHDPPFKRGNCIKGEYDTGRRGWGGGGGKRLKKTDIE